MTKIIMPEAKIDKDKLTEEQKDELLRGQFRMDDDHAVLPPAKNGISEDYFKGDEHLLKPPGDGPEVTSAPLVRGKMLGEAQGMKPRLPLATHATTVGEDSSLDNVPPMRRAQVLEDRQKEEKG